MEEQIQIKDFTVLTSGEGVRQPEFIDSCIKNEDVFSLMKVSLTNDSRTFSFVISIKYGNKATINIKCFFPLNNTINLKKGDTQKLKNLISDMYNEIEYHYNTGFLKADRYKALKLLDKTILFNFLNSDRLSELSDSIN